LNTFFGKFKAEYTQYLTQEWESKGNPVFSSKTNLLENKDSQGDLYSRGRRIRTLNKGFGDQSSQTLKPLYFQCFQALLQEE